MDVPHAPKLKPSIRPSLPSFYLDNPTIIVKRSTARYVPHLHNGTINVPKPIKLKN